MQEHHGSAAADAAADLCPSDSPSETSWVADAAAARAVQAGVALTMLEMGAWRLEGALADPAGRTQLAVELDAQLARRDLAQCASQLRRLVALLSARESDAGGAADSPGAEAPAADCVRLLLLYGDCSRPAGSSPSRGAWAVLRALAQAAGLASRADRLAEMHRLPPALVRAAADQLADAGLCVVVSAGPTGVPGPSRIVRLTAEGLALHASDPLGALAALAEDAFDADAWWRFIRLGAVLLHVEANPAPPAAVR